jgi:hypothetical protein
MRTPLDWCILLVACCMVAPYLLGIGPKTRRDWLLVTAAITFLTWLLGGFASVRAGEETGRDSLGTRSRCRGTLEM